MAIKAGVFKQSGGFSLTEMLIVVALFAILTVIAVPAYTEQVAKTRRVEAKSAILGLAQALERFNTENGSFTGATIGSGGIYPDEAPLDGGDKYYDLNLAIAGGGSTYTITAAPKGTHSGDECGTYSLTAAGVKSLSGNSQSADYCGW